MTEYNSYEEYHNEVQAMAKRYSDWAREGAEEIRTSRFDPEHHEEIPNWAIAHAALNNHKLIQYYKRSVVKWCQEGFYNQGGEMYYDSPEDQEESLLMLAKAGLFNDLISKIRHIEETREKLGEAIQLIEGPIMEEGVSLEYKYSPSMSSDSTMTYTFECLGEGEWRMYDPDEVGFEVISANVAVESRDQYVPEYGLKLFLDNICAKRERERSDE